MYQLKNYIHSLKLPSTSSITRIPTSKRNATKSHLRDVRYSTSKCSEKKINIQALAPQIHPIQLSLPWISTNAVGICIDG